LARREAGEVLAVVRQVAAWLGERRGCAQGWTDRPARSRSGLQAGRHPRVVHQDRYGDLAHL